ncbi:hypothetical protein AB0F42_24170 [Streptomyces buecherae]|uniref:hypothetical protein n=1 Tax=Streptomyces buecherae TaxID=2763006 RepID=UPI003404816D
MRERAWVPPAGETVTLLPTGERWDAVRTHTAIAARAFDVLDGIEGSAAIIDPHTCTAYWLLPPREAARAPWEQWERLRPYVTVLPARTDTSATYLGVPPAGRHNSPGLHWRVPGGWSGQYLSRPAILSAALAPAVLAVHGADALPLRCQVCDRAVEWDRAVTAVGRRHPDDPVRRRLTTHRACARHAHLTIKGPAQ